ncbi:Tat pathway signal protein, partial [Streptomyces sp. NPDC048270]
MSTVLTCLFGVLAALLPVGAAQAAPAAQDCVAVAEGRHAGTFATAGQTHCLELPSPQGARVAALTSRGGAGVSVQVDVVDRNGAAQCGSGDLVGGECALTGAAPFRALVRADDAEATGPYGVHFVRTDVLQAGCQVLPAGSFADESAAVRLETGNGVFSHCLTIPADAHSTSELLRIRYGFPDDTELFPDWRISIIDTDGNGPSCYSHPAPGQNIRTDSLISCGFAAGKAYTVLLEGQDAPRSHTFERRDDTVTAKGCTASAATAIGAPAAAGTSGQNGSLRCHRITTAAATDRLHIDPRDAHDSTHMLVMDKVGGIVCHPRTWACTVTGSTSYQVVTQVPDGWTLPASHRLDAWRIATASGPAPECPRAGSVAHGYGPLTGTLSEERTAVCAVLPSVSGDRFRADVTATDGGQSTPEVSLYSGTERNLCSGNSSPYECQTLGEGLFVLGLPDRTDRTAYRAELTCTNAPCGPEELSVGTVTPNTAQSGTVATLTVQGTALSMKTTVKLTGGPTPLTATTVSVSEDARTLKATVDLRTAPAGIWNISVSALNFQYPRGTLTVTPPATSGQGTYKPVTPTRLMDTRSGLGVPKAKVGQGGTVTLQVTGTAGIPASGVTAVVLNVTATDPTTSSHVSVHPDGTARSSASNLNFTAGQTIPNLVVVPVVNGRVSFYNNAGSVDLIADIAGYYTTDGSGSTYKPVTPTRLMDTR